MGLCNFLKKEPQLNTTNLQWRRSNNEAGYSWHWQGSYDCIIISRNTTKPSGFKLMTKTPFPPFVTSKLTLFWICLRFGSPWNPHPKVIASSGSAMMSLPQMNTRKKKKKKKEKSLCETGCLSVWQSHVVTYTPSSQQPAVTVTAGAFVSSSVWGMSTLVLWERVNISASGDTCSQVFRARKGGMGAGVRLASGQTATYL